MYLFEINVIYSAMCNLEAPPQSKQHQQVPIHGLTILQEGTVVVEILVQGFLRNHSPWLGESL